MPGTRRTRTLRTPHENKEKPKESPSKHGTKERAKESSRLPMGGSKEKHAGSIFRTKDTGSKEALKNKKKKSNRRSSLKSAQSSSSNTKLASPNHPIDDTQNSQTISLRNHQKRSKEREIIISSVGRSLSHAQFYHGLMPRADCEELMKNIGDFLVRRTTINGEPAFILSVMIEKKKVERVTHIRIIYSGGLWSIEDDESKRTSSILALVKLYEVEKSTHSDAQGPFLKTVVRRPDFYLIHEDIEVGEEIGKGAFGTVHKGKLKKDDSTLTIDVAIKKMKTDTNNKKKNLLEFFKECRLMLRFDHSNIVKVYGIAPGDTPVLIVLELASGGSLKSFCKKNDPVSNENLVKFARDALSGMHYLQTMKVIHRDLAARNCLLGSHNELKISDFGLSHVGDTLHLETMKSVPIKWLAPETLHTGTFSHKTDVWAYGVLLWEIFSRCRTDPFPGQTNTQAKDLILSRHPPMDPLPNMCAAWNEIMADCFVFKEDKRPDFIDLYKKVFGNEAKGMRRVKSTGKSLYLK